MRNRVALFLAAVFLLLPTALVADSPKIFKTYLPIGLYTDYVNMLDGRNPVEIEDISQIADKRMLAEPLLFQVAPVLGGCDCEVRYAPYEIATTPHARSIEQVRRGVEIGHGVAGFTDDSRFSEGIALSDPILKGEDFYVGFYTHESREDILSLRSDDEIRNLRFGVGFHWEIDNIVLNDNNFKIITADSWRSVLKLLELGRADVVLQPFTPEEDFVFTDPGTGSTLKPIPGIKMPFDQGRHFFVSTTHPDGENFLRALNAGLRLLASENILQRTMEFAGVINSRVSDFRVLGKN